MNDVSAINVTTHAMPWTMDELCAMMNCAMNDVSAIAMNNVTHYAMPCAIEPHYAMPCAIEPHYAMPCDMNYYE